MNSGFTQSFTLSPADQAAGPRWSEPRLMGAVGYVELVDQFAGCTFEDGLYRLHDAESGPRGEVSIADAFPDFAGHVCPFAVDWLGRQFGLDARRSEGGEALVLLMEPGTGQALEIPFSFRSFHENLNDLREPALAVSFFSQWAAENRGQIPLDPQECVGYKVPLFLGGQDAVDNLEVIDLQVYWSVCGQLRQGTKRLPAGASVRQISIG